MKLLTKNTKLNKGNYDILGLALAPHKQSGRNVCPEAGECANACVLWYRGMTVMPNVRKAMLNRTDYFFDDRKGFLSQLHSELAAHNKRSNALVRLNVASDLRFEKIDDTLYTNYPNITFYAYTKIFNRARDYVLGKLPKNLHVTYSWSERSDKRRTNWLLKNGGNVAMVLDVYYGRKGYGQLPSHIQIATKTWPVVDGDINDARIPAVDGRGVIVGLRAKIKNEDRQKYINSKFVVGSPWRI